MKRILLAALTMAATSIAVNHVQFGATAHPGHDHAAPTGAEQAGDLHEHRMVEISAQQPVPTVNLIAHPDSRRGWNLEVRVTNFQFAPEHVNQAGATTAEGHAHLYIDGVKITRLYGNWYYLESLAPGKHEVMVNLNTNDHGMLMHNGQPIQSIVTIDVPVATK
jgi:hypothetical protein